jgi:hypothetical protein
VNTDAQSDDRSQTARNKWIRINTESDVFAKARALAA